MRQLKRIVTKAENCFQRCVIELRKTRGAAGIPIDVYLNTCLDCVEMVNRLPNISEEQRENARERDLLYTLSYRSTVDPRDKHQTHSQRERRHTWKRSISH